MSLKSFFLFTWVITALLIGACVSLPWIISPLERVHTVTDSKVSTLPAYDLTAAEWVDGQPLLVNKDFNFGMAMSMEGVGVAIAAGMRINKNKELATKLKSLPLLELDQRWNAVANKVDNSWKDKQVVIYLMLFGQPQAQLRTIVEFHAPPEIPQRFMDISDWRSVEGEGSWLVNNGAPLFSQLDRSLIAIVNLMKTELTPHGVEQEYSIQGGEAVQRGRGYVLDTNNESVVLMSTSIPKTVVRYPVNALSLQPVNHQPLP